MTGPPRSSNGASSFHLSWDVPPGEWVGAEAVFEVTAAPRVDRLYFWALQVSFVDRSRRGGAGHLGLQWYPRHPGSTAVNWGGYDAQGRELDGSGSGLASATGNINTRDMAWSPGVRYRLVIGRSPDQAPAGSTAWRASVFDCSSGSTTVVRDLWADGVSLDSPVVWSEVFADCDAPPVEVRWSDMALTGVDGSRQVVDAVRVNYQSMGDGGCANTDSSVDGNCFVQRTSTRRRTPQGALLRVAGGSGAGQDVRS